MEACLYLPVLAPELKKSIEPAADFGRLAVVLRRGDPKFDDEVDKAIESLISFKKDSASLTLERDLPSGLQTLQKYFGQLHLISLRIDMEKNQPGYIKFRWNDPSYFGKVSGSVHIEKFFLLLNIAALHTHLGKEKAKTMTDEDMKKSCRHFQCAAGVFEWTKKHFVGVALDKQEAAVIRDETVHFQLQVSLAHAQQQLLFKAIRDKRKPHLLASLAHNLYENYQALFEEIQLEEIGEFGLKKHPDWYEFTYTRSCFFGALSWHFQGLHLEEQSEYGKCVFCFEKAQSIAVSLPKTTKNKKDEALQAFDALKTLIQEKAETAKRDNTFIFHERIPDSVPEVTGQCLVKPIPFTPYDPDIAGPDLFPSAVPLEAVSATSVYSEKKDSIWRELSEEVEENNEQLQQLLLSLDVESIKLVDDVSVERENLPQRLVERVANLSLKPETAKELQEKLENVSSIVAQIDEQLSIVSDKLDAEGRKGTGQLDRLFAEVDNVRNAHVEGMEKFKVMKEVVKQHVNNLSLMASLSLQQLKAHLVRGDPLDEDEDEKENEGEDDQGVDPEAHEKLRLLLDKVAEMKQQREKFMSEFRSQLDQDDITVLLSAHVGPSGGGCEDQETLFEEQLKKHDKQVSLIRLNLTAQHNICAALEQAYAQYALLRRSRERTRARRDERVEELVTSFDRCMEVKKKLEEKQVVFADLKERVSQLREEVLDTIRERNQRKAKPPDRPTAKKPSFAASSAVPTSTGSETDELGAMLDPEFLKTLTPEERQLLQTLSPDELRQLGAGTPSAPVLPQSVSYNMANVPGQKPQRDINSHFYQKPTSAPVQRNSFGLQDNAMMQNLTEDEKKLLLGDSYVPPPQDNRPPSVESTKRDVEFRRANPAGVQTPQVTPTAPGPRMINAGSQRPDQVASPGVAQQGFPMRHPNQHSMPPQNVGGVAQRPTFNHQNQQPGMQTMVAQNQAYQQPMQTQYQTPFYPYHQVAPQQQQTAPLQHSPYQSLQHPQHPTQRQIYPVPHPHQQPANQSPYSSFPTQHPTPLMTHQSYPQADGHSYGSFGPHQNAGPVAPQHHSGGSEMTQVGFTSQQLQSQAGTGYNHPRVDEILKQLEEQKERQKQLEQQLNEQRAQMEKREQAWKMEKQQGEEEKQRLIRSQVEREQQLQMHISSNNAQQQQLMQHLFLVQQQQHQQEQEKQRKAQEEQEQLQKIQEEKKIQEERNRLPQHVHQTQRMQVADREDKSPSYFNAQGSNVYQPNLHVDNGGWNSSYIAQQIPEVNDLNHQNWNQYPAVSSNTEVPRLHQVVDTQLGSYLASYDPKKPLDSKVLSALLKQQQQLQQQNQGQVGKSPSSLASSKAGNSQMLNPQYTNVSSNGAPGLPTSQHMILNSTSAQSHLTTAQTGSPCHIQLTTFDQHLNRGQNPGIQGQPNQNFNKEVETSSLPGSFHQLQNESGSVGAAIEVKSETPILESLTSSHHSLEQPLQGNLPHAFVPIDNPSHGGVTSPQPSETDFSSKKDESSTVKENEVVKEKHIQNSPVVQPEHRSIGPTLPEVVSNSDVITELMSSKVKRINPIGEREWLKNQKGVDRLKIETEKMERRCVDMEKRSLIGGTMLDKEWKELESRFMTESQHWKTSLSCLELSSCQEVHFESETRSVKCYSDHVLVKTSAGGDVEMPVVDLDLCSKVMPRLLLVGNVSPVEKEMQLFWTSVYQMDISLIVSFNTRQQKCSFVWESAGHNVDIGGDMLVRLQNTSVSQWWLQRTFLLFPNSNTTDKQDKKSSRTLTVTHLQMLDWGGSVLCGDVPMRHTSLVSFVRTVRHFYSLQKQLSQPVLLQCQDGVTQNGLFVLLMYCMQSLDHAGLEGVPMMDICGRVQELRSFHQSLITSRSQLQFTYLACLHYMHQLLNGVSVSPKFQVVSAGNGSLPRLQPVSRDSSLDENSSDKQVTKSPPPALSSLLNPEEFTLSNESSCVKKKPQHDFDSIEKRSVEDLRKTDPNDPLSMLDPLWKLK